MPNGPKHKRHKLCYPRGNMSGKSKPPSRPPAPLTSPKIKHLAGEGLERPSMLTTKQVRELAASVMAHIEPRKPATKKT